MINTWDIQAVYVGGGYRLGSDFILRVDLQDTPHIVTRGFKADGSVDLLHLQLQGTIWISETVAINLNLNFDGDYSFDLDSSDDPHLSYQSNNTLFYAKRQGGQWINQIVDACGVDSSLALDENGLPHIAYYCHRSGYLRYASWNGSYWVLEFVDHINNYSGSEVYLPYVSMVMDSAGFPHITYYDINQKTSKYAHWDGSQWVIQTIYPSFANTSIAVNPLGVPYICLSTNKLELARWSGAYWVI